MSGNNNNSCCECDTLFYVECLCICHKTEINSSSNSVTENNESKEVKIIKITEISPGVLQKEIENEIQTGTFVDGNLTSGKIIEKNKKYCYNGTFTICNKCNKLHFIRGEFKNDDTYLNGVYYDHKCGDIYPKILNGIHTCDNITCIGEFDINMNITKGKIINSKIIRKGEFAIHHSDENKTLYLKKGSYIVIKTNVCYKGEFDINERLQGFGEKYINGKLDSKGEFEDDELVIGYRCVYEDDGSVLKFDTKGNFIPDVTCMNMIQGKLDLLAELFGIAHELKHRKLIRKNSQPSSNSVSSTEQKSDDEVEI